MLTRSQTKAAMASSNGHIEELGRQVEELRDLNSRLLAEQSENAEAFDGLWSTNTMLKKKLAEKERDVEELLAAEQKLMDIIGNYETEQKEYERILDMNNELQKDVLELRLFKETSGMYSYDGDSTEVQELREQLSTEKKNNIALRREIVEKNATIRELLIVIWFDVLGKCSRDKSYICVTEKGLT